MRTLIDIGEPEIRELDELAKRQRKSRSALVRAAVGEYLERKRSAALEDAFGLWGAGEDGIAYQERLRREW